MELARDDRVLSPVPADIPFGSPALKMPLIYNAKTTLGSRLVWTVGLMDISNDHSVRGSLTKQAQQIRASLCIAR